MPLIYKHPAQILLLLRDGDATDFQSLCNAFGVNFDYKKGISSHFELELAETVKELIRVGLLQLDRPPGSVNEVLRGTLFLSKSCLSIQRMLGFSLREMANNSLSRVMHVEPIFGKPRPVSGHSRGILFVLMPFRRELQPVYSDHIKKVAKTIQLDILRGDDIFNNNAIIEDIWALICAADVIVADCTGKNPNVFYEIGLAHCLGQEVILIAQSIDDVPFDLRHLRCIIYEFTPRGMAEFEEILRETITHVMATSK